MHLTLQQLKLFQAVYSHSSYTRAAKSLHLTQPAVSIQVKRLETQVGLPLFDQVGKKIFPTEAGKAMYQAALDILNRINEARNTIEMLKGEIKGNLQISAVTTSKYFMPHLLGQFLTNYADVEPKMVFTNRAKVLERLYNNEDDFVVMGQTPKDSHFISSPFLENILIPVVHPEHPLAKKKNLKLEDLVNVRFLEREQGSGTRLVLGRLLQEKGLKMEPYMELGSIEAIKQGVMAKLGVAVLSLHALRLELAANKMVILDVEGFPVKRRWYAVHLKGKKLPLVAQTFLDYILMEGKNILSSSLK